MDYTDQDNQLFYDELTLITGLLITEEGYHYALYSDADIHGCDWEFIGSSTQTNQD